MKSRLFAIALLLVLGALVTNACALTTGGRANLVEQAGLEDTVAIEVLEFSAWGTESEPYVHRLTITDTEALEGLLEALDTPLEVGLKVQCIPDYELHFHLVDGTVQEFGYSCGGASFLRGNQEFLRGEDYDPPKEFDALFQEELALHPPAPVQASVNVVEEAGLASAVELEIGRLHTMRSSSKGNTVVEQVSFEHLWTLRDAAAVGELVATLDTVLDLVPQAKCLPEYRLRFVLTDGTLYDLSYGCSAEGGPVMRGTQPFWRGMDVHPPTEFNALLDEILNAA